MYILSGIKMIEHNYTSLFYNILKKIDKNDRKVFDRIENSILQLYLSHNEKAKNKETNLDLRIWISSLLRLSLTSYKVKNAHFEYIIKKNSSYIYYPDYEDIFIFNYCIDNCEFYIAYDLTSNINHSYTNKLPDGLYKITIGFKHNKNFKIVFTKEIEHPEKEVKLLNFYIDSSYYSFSEIKNLPLHIKVVINNLQHLNETEFEDLLTLNHDLAVKDIVANPNNVLTSLKQLIDISKP